MNFSPCINCCFLFSFTDAMAHYNARFGQGTVNILLDEVRCYGNESRLLDCRFISNHDCSHLEDASVVCDGTCKNYSEKKVLVWCAENSTGV